MKRIFHILTLSLFLISCEKVIQLDTILQDQRVVVDALLTDEFKTHFVKVTKTIDFNANGRPPGVDNAVVVINDDQGNTFDFIHNPSGDQDSIGFYLPTAPFSGTIGATYTLDVVVDGVTYSAVEILNRVTPIDSLTVRLDPDPDPEDQDAGEIYNVLLYTHEPPETEDYYLFEFFLNGESQTSDEDFYIADDFALAESISGLEAPFNYRLQDTVRVDMISLSRRGYLFYFDLSNVVNNDGGMFSPAPANPRTNISNGGLGLFQVSAVSSETIIITQ